MHFRSLGEGALLLLLHASPGSSKQLEPLLGELGLDRKVIAPDTPGGECQGCCRSIRDWRRRVCRASTRFEDSPVVGRTSRRSVAR